MQESLEQRARKLIGSKFGRLKVVRFLGIKHYGVREVRFAEFECECECGRKRAVFKRDLGRVIECIECGKKSRAEANSRQVKRHYAYRKGNGAREAIIAMTPEQRHYFAILMRGRDLQSLIAHDVPLHERDHMIADAIEMVLHEKNIPQAIKDWTKVPSERETFNRSSLYNETLMPDARVEKKEAA